MFLYPAKANWTKVFESSNGQTFYVNMHSIVETEGHVFFWELIVIVKISFVMVWVLSLVFLNL